MNSGARETVSGRRRWPKRVLQRTATIVMGAVACSTSSAALSIVNAYEHPVGVCRVIVENDGGAMLDLRRVGMSGGGEPLETIWAIAEPLEVPPGEHGFVTYRLKDDGGDVRGTALRHTLHVSETAIEYALAGPPAITVTYLVYDAESGVVYAYLKHSGADACRVEGIRIAGVAVELGSPVPLPAQDVNLACGAWAAPALGVYAAPSVRVEIDSPEYGTLAVVGKLFRPEHTTAIADKPSPPFVECLSHTFPSEADAGAAAVEQANAGVGTLRTIKFCNFDLKANAPSRFAPLAERCRIEPQTAFEEACLEGRYITSIFDAALRTKGDVAPGVFTTLLFGEYIHVSDRPMVGLSQIRNVAYLGLAAGSKGFEFHALTRTDIPPSFQQGLDRIVAELDRLRPLIAVSEPVGWAKGDDVGWCEPHAVLCGPMGLLVIAAPRDPGAHETPRESTIRIEPPSEAWTLGSEALEIGGRHERIPISPGGAHAAMRIAPSEDVRVFYIGFAKNHEP